MNDIFISFPELFVDEIIKMDDLPYQSCVSVIKSLKTEQRKSTNGTNVYCK